MGPALGEAARSPGKGPALLIGLEGLSGAGKTTVSRELASALDGGRLEEAYWRISPPPSLDFEDDQALLQLERQLIAEELRRFREASRLRVEGHSVVLDTDFFGPLTYVWGLQQLGRAGPGVLPALRTKYRGALARNQWALPDLTVYLDVPDATALSRAAAAPRTHPPHLRARHLLVGRLERRLYLERLGPSMGSRFARVSGQGPPESVVARVLRALPSRRLTPRSGSHLALRLLECFEPSSRRPALAGGRRGPVPRRSNR